MIARFVLAAVVAALVSVPRPAVADDPPGKPARKDRTAEMLDKLHRHQVTFDANPGDLPLVELLQFLTKRYEVAFIIREKAFREAGIENVREQKGNLTGTGLKGLTLHQFLSATLDDIGATYLVRANSIEIVPVAVAAKEAKLAPDESGNLVLKYPLVSSIYKEKPLNEAVADLVEVYDLTVVVAPQTGDNKAAFVTARLLNVPADKALDLLAVQADLRVVRKGNTFLITSKDHANELAEEDFQREMRKIELQKLKNPPPGLPGGQVPNGLIPFGLNGLAWPLLGGKK